MNLKQKIIKNNNIKIIFEFGKDKALPIWLQDNELTYILTVTVKSNDTEIAFYQRNFKEEISIIHFQGFIEKFLKDPIYRQQYLVYGEWNDQIIFSDSLVDIHPKCKKQIKYINNCRNLRFKDFVNLKTFGIDKYSKLKIKELEAIIPKDQQNIVKKTFQNEQHIVNTLRWIARGLKTEYAIRKVKSDIEIKRNKLKK